MRFVEPICVTTAISSPYMPTNDGFVSLDRQYGCYRDDAEYEGARYRHLLPQYCFGSRQFRALVILLVIGLIWKDNEGLQYIIGAGLCGVVGVIAMLLGMNAVIEQRKRFESEAE